MRNQTQMQALQYDHSQEMTKSQQEALALRDLGKSGNRFLLQSLHPLSPGRMAGFWAGGSDSLIPIVRLAARGLSAKYDMCARELSAAAQVSSNPLARALTAVGRLEALSDMDNFVCQLNGELQAAVAKGDDEARELSRQVVTFPAVAGCPILSHVEGHKIVACKALLQNALLIQCLSEQALFVPIFARSFGFYSSICCARAARPLS